MQIRRSAERGLVDKGWVRSLHSFNFGRHYHPDHGGFRSLIVLNEDWIEGGQGFERHAHSDTEIITYVVSGQLLHEDSLGNRSVVGAGEVMATTTGRGLAHSETNASPDQAVHLWQIWLLPVRKRREPTCAQRAFAADDRAGRLCLLVSQTARDGSLRLGTDVDLWGSLLGPGQRVEHPLAAGRHAWVQVLRGGPLMVDGERLEAGDGAALEGGRRLVLAAAATDPARTGPATEILLFDLA